MSSSTSPRWIVGMPSSSLGLFEMSISILHTMYRNGFVSFRNENFILNYQGSVRLSSAREKFF